MQTFTRKWAALRRNLDGSPNIWEILRNLHSIIQQQQYVFTFHSQSLQSSLITIICKSIKTRCPKVESDRWNQHLNSSLVTLLFTKKYSTLLCSQILVIILCLYIFIWYRNRQMYNILAKYSMTFFKQTKVVWDVSIRFISKTNPELTTLLIAIFSPPDVPPDVFVEELTDASLIHTSKAWIFLLVHKTKDKHNVSILIFKVCSSLQ